MKDELGMSAEEIEKMSVAGHLRHRQRAVLHQDGQVL